MSANIEAILQSLTLEEKISLLAGKDFWETVPIRKKGVPTIKVRYETQMTDDCGELISCRQAMGPMEQEAKCLVEGHELHVFLRLFAQLRHGIQSLPTGLETPWLKKHKQRALEYCESAISVCMGYC